jgi:hypothetical protein
MTAPAGTSLAACRAHFVARTLHLAALDAQLPRMSACPTWAWAGRPAPRPGEEPDPGGDRTQRQGRGNPAVRATDGWTDDGENVVHLRPAAQMCSMACASSSSWSLSTRCREPLRIDSRAARPIRAKTMTKNAGASSLPVRSMSHTAR